MTGIDIAQEKPPLIKFKTLINHNYQLSRQFSHFKDFLFISFFVLILLDLCFYFVTLRVNMLEAAIRRWVHCSHEGMEMLSNNTHVAAVLKQSSDVSKGVLAKKCLHTITPAAAA